MRRLLPALLLLLAFAPATASAAPAVSGEFPAVGTLSGVPMHLAQGPDLNIWVVLDNGKIAKVTADGAVTEYTPAPALSGANGITTGPDGNLWITQTGGVAKISPGTPTIDASTSISGLNSPQAITVGPDGNLWTASGGNMIRIPPGNPSTAVVFTTFFISGRGIARGGDGQLWVADFGSHKIASVTASDSPTVKFYDAAATGGPMDVAAGPGTQIGFTDPIVQPEEIGRLTPGGTAQRTVVTGGSGDPTGIVFGNDGAYWITRFGGNDLVRFTPDGQQTTLTGFSATAGPRQITKGPGDTLWVGLETAKKVARITGVSAPPPSGGGGGGGGVLPDRTAPVISSLTESHRVWHLGSALSRFSRTRRPIVGTTFRFRVDEQSTTTFSFARLVRGRKVGRRCLADTRARRRRPRCTRALTVRPSLVYTTKPGRHSLSFQGRLTRRTKLKPGRYKLTVTARDAARNVSRARTLTFTVLPAVRR